ncbi:MAG: HAMP domain-containing sensor histidine kinase [Candidatus Portnoybacteria bacterium]
MTMEDFFSQLNIISQCKKYGLSVWQCPQFIFFVMGGVVILSSVVTYAIGNKYIEDPYIVSLTVILVAMILFVLGTMLSKNFEKLAEANRMKSEFISIVSHQLRSPLTNFKWVIGLLLSGRIEGMSGKQLEYIKILKENSTRMTELVSDLLTVSRIEQGRLVVNVEKISLEEVIREMVHGMEVFAEASNVKIHFKIEKNMPMIASDLSQIKLIIENLLDNAIRYSKEKGKVEIEVKRKKNYVYFGVKDSGVGIPAADQKYIFQKFFRSANALRHKTEGSGLGLYITKSIVERLGGKINFNSQEGEGSTFWALLPINYK